MRQAGATPCLRPCPVWGTGSRWPVVVLAEVRKVCDTGGLITRHALAWADMF